LWHETTITEVGSYVNWNDDACPFASVLLLRYLLLW
jgi:hypothetical protein